MSERTATSTVPDGTTGGGGASGATSTDTRAESSPHMPGSGSTPGGSTRGENPFPPKDDQQESKRTAGGDSALGPNQGTPAGKVQQTRKGK